MQIDKRYYDSPYYIVPNDDVGQEAFAVIRDAMKGKGMVALGRIVLHKREHVIALEPFGKGLLGTTLHYAYEVRKAEDYFSGISDIKVPAEMLKLAEHILDTKKGDFDPAQFEDHFENALVELLRKKQAGFKLPKAKEAAEPARNVISLMDALRRSVQNERTPQREKPSRHGREARAPRPKSRRRAASGSPARPSCCCRSRARARRARPRPPSLARPPSPRPPRRSPDGARPAEPGGHRLRRGSDPLFECRLERFLRGKRHTCDGRHIAGPPRGVNARLMAIPPIRVSEP